MDESKMAKNHQCQVTVEKMLNMTFGFNRLSISSIDRVILAALSGNYILYAMYSFGHSSRVKKAQLNEQVTKMYSSQDETEKTLACLAHISNS